MSNPRPYEKPSFGSPHPRSAALLGVILITLASGLGIWVSVAGARKTGELRLDQTLAAHRDSWMTRIAWFCDALFGSPIAFILAVVVCGAIACRNRIAALVFGSTVGLCWVGSAITKLIFARHRPPTIEAHALIHKSGLNSFPSGHTAFAASVLAGAVLALRVTGRSTRAVWLLGVPGVLIVAWSRLYLGAHYLGDVIGAMLYVSGLALIGMSMMARYAAVKAGGRSTKP